VTAITGSVTNQKAVDVADSTDDLDASFGHWLAGFTDGEGCFRIKTTNQGTYQCRFSIGLRADDAPILFEIQDRLGGIGTLCHSGKNNARQEQWRWEVNAKTHVAKLVDVYDAYPLRAKKAQDFAIWREAVQIWLRVENGKRYDWHEMAECAARLKACRQFVRPAEHLALAAG
jgi:hypothetical protein